MKWSAREDKRNWLKERAAAEEKAAEKEGEGRMCERQGSALPDFGGRQSDEWRKTSSMKTTRVEK